MIAAALAVLDGAARHGEAAPVPDMHPTAIAGAEGIGVVGGTFYPFQCYSYMEEILNILIRVARELNFSLYQMTEDENDILRRIRQSHTLSTCQKIFSDFIMEFATSPFVLPNTFLSYFIAIQT